MSLQQTLLASALLSTLAAASPQWGGPGNNNGGNWGNGGPFAGFPSCASSCRPANIDYSNPGALCSDSNTLNSLNSCIDTSSCNDDDKNNVRQTIAQLCVNAGASITQAPYNTYGVTSGEWASATGGAWVGGDEAQWSAWASQNGVTGYPSASAEWASWASANGLPTKTAEWASWASSHGWGGSAWPTAWTTNSAWASAVSAWSASGYTGGPPGYHGGPNGPFGHPWGAGGEWSSGAWENGPWTKWWGTNACPPSTWSGWTAGPWSDDAPWTTWTACTATATASTVYEITTTNAAGSQITQESTSYGYQVAEVTNGLSSTTSGSGAEPTNFAVIGSAAGVLGVLAGAVLL